VSNVLKTYDFVALIITFRGVVLGGFADDSLMKITRNEETWRLKVGTTGEAARARNRNRSGSIELSLLQSASENDLLSQILAQDELDGTGIGPAMVRDLLGTTLVHGDGCFLEKPADSSYSKEIETRPWKIIVPDMDMFVGGHFAA
jgi:hypothetical protein